MQTPTPSTGEIYLARDGRRWFIESVYADDPDDECEGFGLVNIVPEDGRDDMSHPDAMELSMDEWAAFAAGNELRRV